MFSQSFLCKKGIFIKIKEVEERDKKLTINVLLNSKLNSGAKV
jgi:hypothetical protein